MALGVSSARLARLFLPPPGTPPNAHPVEHVLSGAWALEEGAWLRDGPSKGPGPCNYSAPSSVGALEPTWRAQAP